MQRGRGRGQGHARGWVGYTNARYQLQQSTPQNRRILTAERRMPLYGQSDNFAGENVQEDSNDFSYGANIPVSNRYGWLGEEGDRGTWSDDEITRESHDRQSTLAGKTKLSSPLDSSPKRQREYTSDTSRHSDNMDYEVSRGFNSSGNSSTRGNGNINIEEITRL